MAERPLMLLVDGNALMHRAYHAIPPLSNVKGEPTNATFGFTSTLLKVLEDYRPKYAAVAWDVGRTFRHDQYAEYKATRPSMPEDLRVQMERIREVVAAFHLSSKFLAGYEADDVLAALSKQAEDRGLDVLIATGDTDTLQLVGPHVRVLLSGRRFTDTKVYDEAAIRERYGLDPAQLVDFKSLTGDKSDNIPGVPGAGFSLSRAPSMSKVVFSGSIERACSGQSDILWGGVEVTHIMRPNSKGALRKVIASFSAGSKSLVGSKEK